MAFLVPAAASPRLGSPKPMPFIDQTALEEENMSRINFIASVAAIFALSAYLALSKETAADEGHEHTMADRKPVCLKEYPHEADELNEIVGPHPCRADHRKARHAGMDGRIADQ